MVSLYKTRISVTWLLADVMISWIVPEKRRFFYILIGILLLEIILISLIIRSEHSRFLAVQAPMNADASMVEQEDELDPRDPHSNLHMSLHVL